MPAERRIARHRRDFHDLNKMYMHVILLLSVQQSQTVEFEIRFG